MWRALLAACAVAGSVGAAAAVYGLARFRLPEPAGPDAVGTLLLQTSPSVVQVWYPALPAGARRRAPYRFGSSGGSLRARIFGALIRTNAFVDAPVLPGRHPFLVYVAGWGGTRADNTALIEDLASHGYVVAAFDDVRAEVPMDFGSAGGYRRTLRVAQEKLDAQVAAARDLLDRLQAADGSPERSRLARRIDFERIGALGFSFGGAAAAQLARDDPRVKAAVNLDGWMFGSAAGRGVPKPFLIVSSAPDAAGAGDDRSSYELLLDRQNEREVESGLRRYGGYVALVRGTRHFDFCDASLLPSVRHTGLGSLDGRQVAGIVARYVGAFFEESLDGRPSPLLADAAGNDDAERPDPHVRLVVWPRRSAPERGTAQRLELVRRSYQ